MDNIKNPQKDQIIFDRWAYGITMLISVGLSVALYFDTNQAKLSNTQAPLSFLFGFICFAWFCHSLYKFIKTFRKTTEDGK